MGENIIILFIFFVLLIFAIVFFARLQGAKTDKAIEEDVEGRAVQIAQRIAFLPEVQCTRENAEIFPDCYDEFSLRALQKLSGDLGTTSYYFDLFGNSIISVKKLFPVVNDTLIVYNNPKTEFTSITTSNTPITVCDFRSTLRKGLCSFGVLKVEVYN